MDPCFHRCVDFVSTHRPSFMLLPTAIVAGALVLHLTYTLLLRRTALCHFPQSPSQGGIYLRQVLQYVYRAETLYMDGYRKFRKTIYRLTTSQGECLVIPVELMDELRHRPDSELDAGRAINIIIDSAHTGIDVRNTLGGETLARTLSRRLPHVCSLLSPEVNRAVESALLPLGVNGASWTALAPFDFISRAIFTASGFFFVGPELGHSMDYLDANLSYVADLFLAARTIKAWPTVLRRVALLPLVNPAMARIRQHERRVKELLVPVIGERKRRGRERKSSRARAGTADLKRGKRMEIQGVAREQGKEEDEDEDGEGTEEQRGGRVQNDLLQLMIAKHDSQAGETMNDEDLDRLTQGMMLNTGGILSACCVLTQILYDLVVHPEVIPELRAEISSALLASSGIMTVKALAQMKLLDSVMAESFRMTPLLMTRFSRYVPYPITLRDGTTIPANTSIEVPSFCVARDPALYPDPDVFDPYRFYRLRAAAAAAAATDVGSSDIRAGDEREGDDSTRNTNNYDSSWNKKSSSLAAADPFQFVAVNKQSLGWGYGRHACPGRHFAGMLIKMVLARVLLDYELGVPAEEAVRSVRYAPVKLAGTIFPDLGKMILMKRREGEKTSP